MLGHRCEDKTHLAFPYVVLAPGFDQRMTSPHPSTLMKFLTSSLDQLSEHVFHDYRLEREICRSSCLNQRATSQGIQCCQQCPSRYRMYEILMYLLQRHWLPLN